MLFKPHGNFLDDRMIITENTTIDDILLLMSPGATKPQARALLAILREASVTDTDQIPGQRWKDMEQAAAILVGG